MYYYSALVPYLRHCPMYQHFKGDYRGQGKLVTIKTHDIVKTWFGLFEYIYMHGYIDPVVQNVSFVFMIFSEVLKFIWWELFCMGVNMITIYCLVPGHRGIMYEKNLYYKLLVWKRKKIACRCSCISSQDQTRWECASLLPYYLWLTVLVYLRSRSGRRWYNLEHEFKINQWEMTILDVTKVTSFFIGLCK